MDKIYTLTVIRSKALQYDRTWVWFKSYEEAVLSLHKDTEFYFEQGYYDYCVIEEVYNHSIGPHKQFWFKVDYIDSTKYSITSLKESPEFALQIVNFSMG